jgi:hypothetical protein
MKTTNLSIMGAVALVAFAGCASQPVPVSPVGPEPVHVQGAAHAPKGYLRVFTDTNTRHIGDEDVYYTHTGYSICSLSGKQLKYVPNHIGDMDESPTLVTLRTGDYDIVAESASYGRVTVPVVVEGARTTVVHLDRAWKPAKAANQVVRLPDGEAIGWRTTGGMN